MIRDEYKDNEVIKAVRSEFKLSEMVLLEDFLKNNPKISNSSKELYIPDQCCYLRLPKLALDKDFKDWVYNFINKKVKISVEVLKFKKGCFSVFHDKTKNNAKLEMMLFLSKNWESSWGGKLVLIDSNGKNEIIPKNGSLVIINSKKVKSYFQYVNHLARNNSFVILKLAID